MWLLMAILLLLSMRTHTQRVQDMVGISENLLSSTLSQGWVGVVEEAGFRAEEFLETLEYLSATALDVVWQDSSPREHLLISTRRLSPGSSDNEMIFADSLLLEDLSATVELPVATPTSSVAMAMFSNLGPALNSYTFNSNASEPLAVATPILSVQMFNEGSKVTTLAVPFNLTLPYKGRLFLPHLRSMAACGWWQTGDRSVHSSYTAKVITCMSHDIQVRLVDRRMCDIVSQSVSRPMPVQPSHCLCCDSTGSCSTGELATCSSLAVEPSTIMLAMIVNNKQGLTLAL